MSKPFPNLSIFVLIIFLICGCSKNEEFVPDLLKLSFTVNDVTTNGGQDGSVFLTVEGGVPPYEYIWSNGAITKDIGGLTAGMYSVFVKDDLDSTAYDSVFVDQPLPDTTVTDIEGNIYNIVVIGEQTWMQENLRVTKAPDGSDIESYIYNNDPGNEIPFGRLYTWDAAMNGSTEVGSQGVCPAGWHIPSDEEWKTLEIYLGMDEADANIVNGWRGNEIGTKLKSGGESGYEALLCGRRTNIGSYQLLGSYEYIWTSTEFGTNYAWRRCLRSSANTIGRWNTFPKTYAFSVRCIKNSE